MQRRGPRVRSSSCVRHRRGRHRVGNAGLKPCATVGSATLVCSFRFWCGARLQRVQFSACGVGHGFCVCSSPLVVWRTASAVRAWTTNGYARCCR